jgi:hypothetical protein
VLGRFAAALALAAALIPAAAHANEAKPTVFSDPVGDAGTAADITRISVTNDDAGVYRIVLGFATPIPQDGRVFVYLDTDLNQSTGSPQSLGADYAFGYDGADGSSTFYVWSNGDWADAPPTSSVAVTSAPDATSLTLVAGKSDLGGSTGFNFFVLSEEGDGAVGRFDDAPSGEGAFEYRLQPTVVLSLVAATSYPVKAGGRWTLVLVARRSDTGKTLGAEGAIACSASTGAVRLALTARAFVSAGAGAGSGAVCSFKVPRRLEHRVLHGTIAVRYHGEVVRRRFTATVK